MDKRVLEEVFGQKHIISSFVWQHHPPDCSRGETRMKEITLKIEAKF